MTDGPPSAAVNSVNRITWGERCCRHKIGDSTRVVDHHMDRLLLLGFGLDEILLPDAAGNLPAYLGIFTDPIQDRSRGGYNGYRTKPRRPKHTTTNNESSAERECRHEKSHDMVPLCRQVLRSISDVRVSFMSEI